LNIDLPDGLNVLLLRFGWFSKQFAFRSRHSGYKRIRERQPSSMELFHVLAAKGHQPNPRRGDKQPARPNVARLWPRFGLLSQ
jgi:hypothetical protein